MILMKTDMDGANIAMPKKKKKKWNPGLFSVIKNIKKCAK